MTQGGIFMTERELEKRLEGEFGLKQEEIQSLKESVRKEIMNHSWRQNHLTWVGRSQERVAQKTHDDKLKVISKLHQEYDKKNYPHHVLGGNTWTTLIGGMLTELDYAVKDFYKKDYKNYLEAVENLETAYPIFVVGNYYTKLSGKVVPLIIDYNNNKKVIVLYINK